MQLGSLATSTIAVAAAVMGAAAWAYEPIEFADGGTITGVVTYPGTPPAPATITVTKDPEVCGSEKTAKSLLVGPTKGIRNVVVRLLDVQKGKKLAEPRDVTFKQKGCDFSPRVLLFPAGSRIRIRNDDGILHNITLAAENNPSFTLAQPKFRRYAEKRIEEPEMAMRVRCDVHAWMGAWWVSQEHPYYAVTNTDGAFVLDDVPPGSYALEAWHETLGRIVRPVIVTAKTATSLTIAMTPSPPPPGAKPPG